jgi:hypothetical protein
LSRAHRIQQPVAAGEHERLPRVAAPPAVVCLAIVVAFVALSLLRFNFTIDDAYITFRYARNLAAGLGAVYNPGERVEGYSSPLWMFLIAGAIRLGLNTVLFGKLFGLASAVATILLILRRGPRLFPDSTSTSVVAAALLAAGTPWMLWAIAGLETPLFILLSTAALFCFWDEIRRGRMKWTGPLFALATLTRPEGLLLAGAAGLSWAFLKIRRGDARVRSDEVWTAVLFAAPLLAHLAWRYAYYGSLVPNTYYTKARVGQSFDPYSLRFLESRRVEYFLGFALAHVGLPLVGFAASKRVQVRRGEARDRAIAAIPFMLVTILFVWQVYGDWMPGYRFLLPFLPVSYLYLASLFSRPRSQPPGENANENLAVPRNHLRNGLAAGAVLATLLGSGLVVYVGRGDFGVGKWAFRCDFRGDYGAYPDMARWINKNIPKRSLVTLYQAGYLGYHCDFRLLDLGGLIDPVLARVPADLTRKIDLGYVLGRKPDYMLMINYADAEGRRRGEFQAQNTADHRMHEDLRFKSCYSISSTVECFPNAWDVFERDRDLVADIHHDWANVVIVNQVGDPPLGPVPGVDGVEVNGVGRDAILAVAPSCFEYRLRLDRPSILALGFAAHPTVWGFRDEPDSSDGMIFQVDVVRAGDVIRVLDERIDATHDLNERRWHDRQIDLGGFIGETVTLRFATKPGGNDFADWGLWATPVIAARGPSNRRP